jgi:hypothetical protein
MKSHLYKYGSQKEKVKYIFGEEGGGGDKGGLRYQTRLPRMRLGRFNISMNGVITIPRGGNRKGT